MNYSNKTKNIQRKSSGSFVFFLYIYFIIDFFLHLSARIPGYGLIRPTLLLTIIIGFSLVANRKKLSEFSNEVVFKSVFWMMLFVLITLPFSSWPGSVLLSNIPSYIKVVVFLFFTAIIIDTEKRLMVFLLVFCACQLFRIFEPLYLHVTSGYWGDKTYLGEGEFAERLSGAPSDVVNPNGLGFVIVTIIPYLHYLLWRSDKYLYNIIYIITMPTIIYALILTMSRGAFLALLIVIWTLFKESRHKFGMLVIVIIAASIAWINMSDVHKDRYSSLMSSNSRQSATVEGRKQGVVDEFFLAMERPIIGHGLGTSREAKYHAGLGALISHDLYTEVLIETGFVGFIIFFRFLKAIYLKYKENMEKMKNSRLYGVDSFAWRLNSALGSVFWMYIVYSINYFGLSDYYWYMFAGIMVSFSRIFFNNQMEPTNA